MKLLVCLAAAAASSATLAVDAAPQSGWHVRVHVHEEPKKGVSETCYASGGSVACRDELTCVQVSDWYGACMKKEPSLMEQCGGHSTKGPWKYPCVPTARGTNSTCVFISPYFSQCQDLASREQYRFKGHHAGKKTKKSKDHDASKPIPLWGQCKWADASAKCESDLQCITENDHYGQCRKTKAGLYDQCGGKSWKGPWSATCEGTSVCVRRDEWYSQCLPSGTPATASPAPPVTTTPSNSNNSNNGGGGGGAPPAGPTADKWSQCGGANFQGPTACAAGSTCVKQSNWYSQCKPEKLPVGELCGENKRDSTWTHASCEGSAKCVASNADGSESRCKA